MNRLIPAKKDRKGYAPNEIVNSSSAYSLINAGRKVLFGKFALLLLCLIVFSSQSHAQGTWHTLTNTAPHSNGGIMLVMTDGTILCKTNAGGSGQGTLWDKLTPDSHGSYLNGTWSTITAMANDRLYFTSQVLVDGRVYVAGGEYGAGGSLAEVYDPVANTWSTATTSSGTPFLSDCNSEILPDGTVLEAIQSGTTRANYIYNPTTNTATATGTCFGSHDEAAWLKLPDNSILQVDILSTNAERYIPSTGAWIHDAACPVQLYDSYGLEAGGAVLLPNGNAFFIGATGHTAIYTPSGTTSNGSWVAGPDIPNSYGTPDAPCAMMINGKVLLAVSPLPRSAQHFPDSTLFYEYDYSANSYTQVSTPIGGTVMNGWPTFISNMTDLPDGNVLYSYQSGGYYIYTPSGSAIAAGQPTVNSIFRDNCDTFTATGTLFNGISEGSSYGDDWQNNSNYPIIRLTSGTNVYYAKTYGWNSTGVSRGTALDTVQFILPAGLPTGSYTLAVVANGIPSAGTSFNAALTISPATPSVCVGSTVTLSDAWTGGVWASSNTSIATVGSSAGVVTGVGSGTATITYTFGGGCTSTVTISVNAAPTSITGTTTACVGGTSTLGSTPGGGTWTSSAVGVATIGSSSGTFTGVSAGTSNITYTLTGGCFANTTVTVITAPAAITGPSTVCNGTTVTLSDVTPGGTWTSSNVGLVTIGSSSGIATGLAVGCVTITYTVGTCFSTFSLCDQLTPAAIGGPSSVCIGTPITLTDITGGGTWSSSNANATIGTSSGIVTGVSAGTSTISYTLGSGCFAITQVTVDGAAPITGPSSVCAGGTIVLSDVTPGGSWSSSNSGQATVGSSSGAVTGVAAGTTPTISYTLPGGCFATQIVSVTTTPGAITGTTTVCTGATTTLSSSPGGGTWTSGATGIATAGSSSGVISGISVGTAGITYSLGTGCQSTTTVTVNSGVAVITGTPTACVGSTTTLSDATGGGSWTSSDPTIASVGAGTGVVTGVTWGAATISYTVGGCSATIPVTIDSFIAFASISGGGIVSVGGTLGLTDAVAGGTWSSSGANATVGSATGIVTGVSVGTVTISYGVTNACGLDYSTRPVTVVPTSCVSVISGPASVCVGATITLTDTASGGVWSSANTAIATVGSGSGIVTGIVADTVTIVYYVGPSCVATKLVTVNTSAAPITGLLGTCTGGTTTLADATPGGTWSSSNPAIATIGSATGFVNGITPGSTIITYSVGAGCAATRAFVVHPVPAPVAVIGGGGYCAGGAGVNVGITGSAMGISYQLYRGGVAVGAPLPGIGGMLYFGLQTVAGVYTVVGTDTITMCSTTMTGSVTVSIYGLPNIYTVTGGGSYCSGGTGVTVGLSSSDVGINYQLYRGGLPVVGTITAGTGAAISFGLQTVAGIYTVVATNAGFTACTAMMSGSTTISINPLPNVYAVMGGGGYCIGGTGVLVGLANSDLGVNYQLYHAGVAVGAPVAGIGGPITFGLQVAAGTYTVVATNATTLCVNNMSGSATVTINALPNAYTVVGGGSYCTGGSGVPVGLIASSFGVNYQLYRGGVAVGTPVAGTGAGISFGLQTVAGTYTVVATNATTGCVNNMTGSVVVSVIASPTVYTVTGGGGYCAGGIGVHVGLSNSDIGTSYQLYLGVSAVGSAVAGTGAPLDFGLKTTAGTYTVVANITGTSCSGNMSGSVVVTINPLPTVYNVLGGGGYCVGATGVDVKLSGSDVGVNYQLFNGGIAVGAPVAGTGALLDFGLMTAGTYTVVATNATTGCTDNMTGSATVIINPLPTVYTVTGGGSYCTGGTGVTIGLSGSQVGVNYILFYGTTPVSSPVAGTGAAISFGTYTAAGLYTVTAINATTSCQDMMSGSATITISSLPNVYSVTGGGSYCAGGTGVVVGLSNSDVGVNYQLYIGGTATGSPVSGSGSAISFGLQTTASTYTVVAIDATTGCISAMSGSAMITINPLPVAVSVTGGGGYCAGGTGVSVGLSASVAGINYQLYLGGVMTGSPVAGIGAAISFGLQTTAGTYTVVATNITTGCTNNMTGSAVVTINPLPNLYTVTGGGSYCSGGTGVVVGLSSSDVGVNYQLYLGGLPVVGTITAGTGVAISFGLRTAAGIYTVVATSAGYTGCASTMSGSATIAINPLPTVYTVTGGGSYCVGGSGVLVGLSNSDLGINYSLYQGGVLLTTVSGTGAAFNFAGTFMTAGTYTVVATNATTGCVNNMSGSATVTINPLPTVYAVTGGGSYCSGGTGVTVGLMASTFGVNYQLYRGGVAVGSPVAGTGAGITFGLQTVAGTYTVVATNATTGCVNNMSGSAVVTVIALPNIYTITGGGSYCAGGIGVHVGLSNSDPGTSYQLYRGGTAIGSPMAGTGAALDFGLQTTAGTYTIVAAITGTLCTMNMSGSTTITINPLPTVYSVIGGGSYCLGGAGVHVKLSGSNTGINYQLFNGGISVGSPLPGTGALLDFGLITVAGTYTVIATNAATGCTDNMAGSVTITINPLPTAYTVTGGGAYCSGGTGVVVGLSNSQTGVNYQLYLGASAVGSPIAGTGIAISFGLRTVAGIYTVVATNATTGCTSNMSGSATVTINPLPNIYTVTGGGSYCSGGTGVNICMSNSDVGISYQLYRGTLAVGSAIPGSGFTFCFPPQTVTGTYTVIATNTSTGCMRTMGGSATVSINPLPYPLAVTGGGSYCAGGAGVHVGLAGSVVGTTYQLLRGVTFVGSPLAGTGAALDFGLQTVAGTYTVVATNTTTGCSNNMSGSVTIAINPVPTAYTVTGGGSYCAGGTGVAVGLNNSALGVKYRLHRGGTPVGAFVLGTGSAIPFGLQTNAGTYTVVATDMTTGCTANMTGSVTITVNPLPTVYNVIGGGSFCAGGAGVHVKLSGSNVGINYQLYLGGVALGSPMSGTSGVLDFGLFTTSGTYTVVATNPATTCTKNMAGSVTITVNPSPTAYTVTGGGSYCSGPGLHIGLSGSNTGISYQLFIGGTTPVGVPLAGTGIALDFGAKTVAGTYTVVATNTTTGCTSNMTGSAVITTGTLPTAFTVIGGGSYCAGSTGVSISLNGSSTGISYQLFLGSTAVGAAVAGTGASISFGVFTTAGTYTAVATNTTTGCTANMTGSAIITVNPLPTAFTVTGGGTYCTGGSGVHIGLGGSATGITYQLLFGGTTVSTMLGTGLALDFGLYTSTGTYTVVATNTTTGCTATMTGTAVVGTITAPTTYTVTGGGSYCSGGTGLSIGLSGSQIGVNYQLYIGGATSGAPVAGTGLAISFGARTAAGTYTVVASATGTACTANMTGSATITVNALPTIDTVTGGGTTCSAGPGVHVGLNTSTTGISYQLYRSGTAVGSPLPGTGSSLDFGPFLISGTYTVVATNSSTGCTGPMYGSAIVTIATSPVAIAMTGGGGYCSGSGGVHVGLAASAIGVNYQLYRAGSPVGAPVAGIGAALDFGLQTTAGVYTAVGTYAGTSCSSNMTGSATVTVYALPTVDTVIGGGGYCSGGSGVHIKLNSSSTGVSYKLFLTGTPVISMSGTGALLDFGLYTTAGTYTIVATNTVTGCTSSMYGSAIITVNPNPVISGTIYTVAPAGTITLTGSIGGGSWTSSATTIATIGSTSGVVTGVALGTTIISYTLPTGCAGGHTVAVTPTGHRDGPTGLVTTAGSSNISVTPNPNHGTFTVKGTLATIDDEEVRFEITNMLGQVVYSDKVLVQNGELDKTVQVNGALANGMYLLTLRSASENQVFHIVVEQ